ncbi:hypothetical protein C7S13_5913 [Burkholderia cepacia]|nr:hypothetical protein [Burkholderia cepacia]
MDPSQFASLAWIRAHRAPSRLHQGRRSDPTQLPDTTSGVIYRHEFT